MKPILVRYGRTVTKDYQSERIDVEISLEPKETFVQGLARAKKLVNTAFKLLPNADEIRRAKETLQQAGEDDLLDF